ncbi:hypothetical protein NMY22_g6358 [Coprinellus aureogranulatus]|nr:hypothetical protein NMY22_g6358 [Coprinellus aureogranulatus]
MSGAHYYDPYDFSDDSSDEDPNMQTEDDSHDEDVSMEVETDDESVTTPTEPDASASTASTASLLDPGLPASVQSSYTSYEPQRYDEGGDGDDEGMVSETDSSTGTFTYRRELPADEEERLRLQRQHNMFIDMMGAKYPQEMKQVLHSTIQGEKWVLDIGCGNGDWIRDVAQDFPLSACVAIDLAPIRDPVPLPPNVRVELDDINLGLEQYYGKFDVVHCRLISSGVRDYQLLIERISRTLRPGGLVELAEFDFTIYDRNRKQLDISLHDPIGPPYWARYLAHLNAAIRKKQGDVSAANHLWRWLTTHQAFENITYRDVWVPSIPGDDDRYPETVYPVMRQNISAFVRSGKPLLLGSGVSEEEYQILKEHTLKELHHSDEPQYTRMQCIWATKRTDYISPPEDD